MKTAIRGSTADRREQAGWLAALAAFGLVVAPVLHAVEHAGDAAHPAPEARDSSPLDTLADALRQVHGRPVPAAPESHQHSHRPGTSHGEGSLAHFALALHAAPPASELPQPAAAVPHRPQPAPQRATPRYLIPLVEQGPPAA